MRRPPQRHTEGPYFAGQKNTGSMGNLKKDNEDLQDEIRGLIQRGRSRGQSASKKDASWDLTMTNTDYRRPMNIRTLTEGAIIDTREDATFRMTDNSFKLNSPTDAYNTNIIYNSMDQGDPLDPYGNVDRRYQENYKSRQLNVFLFPQKD
jgi:hypothetical protein